MPVCCSYAGIIWFRRRVRTAKKQTAAEVASSKLQKEIDATVKLWTDKMKQDEDPPATEDSPERQNRMAQRIRTYISQEIKTGICACCSRRCRKRDVDQYKWTDVVDLLTVLRADGEQTDELPRDGLTTWEADDAGRKTEDGTKYCLQPVAMRDYIDPAKRVPTGEQGIDLCACCMGALQKSKVPQASLVRVDTGAIPDHLLPLSMFEEALLAIGRPMRYVSVMKPSGNRGGSQYCYRGHLIAFPNVDVSDVRRSFPLSFSEIPKIMQVCFDDTTRADVLISVPSLRVGCLGCAS